MKRFSRFVILYGLLIIVSSHRVYADKEFFVSTNGSDQNEGTESSPFGSLKHARDAIRSLSSADRMQDITVYLEGGTYFLDETVVFDLQDSAPDGYVYTYRAREGHQPVLSSGRKIGNWKKVNRKIDGMPSRAEGNVWEARIPDGVDHPKVLFNGTERLNRARSKGFQGKAIKSPRFASRNVARAKDRYLLKRLPFPEGEIKAWSNLEDAEAIFCPVPWCVNISPIDSVDLINKVAWLAYEGNAAPFTTPKPYNPAYIENMIDFLDEPGEWVYVSGERKIYYWPREATPGDEVMVPTLSEFIKIEGDIQYDQAEDVPVKNLAFEGITFTHGKRYSWWKGHKGWGIQHDWDKFDSPNALFRCRGAENCSITNCSFVNSANSAIRLDLHCQNIRIENNLIYKVGHMGILLCGYGPGTKDVNKNNKIVNNIIDKCGEVIWHGHAIFVWQSGGNYIANNLIQNCPRKAIGICGVRGPIFKEGPEVDWDEASKTLRWNEIDTLLLHSKNISQEAILPYEHAKNNVVENNEVFRCRTKIGDGASLNVSGAGEGNIVRNNLLSEVVGNGLRTDDWQRGTTFENNLILSGGVVHKGHNHILNNVFINTNIRFTTYPEQIPFPGSQVQNNIFYYSKTGIDPYTERHVKNISTPDDCILKNNLYYAAKNKKELYDFLAKSQSKGWDKGSLIEDPLFEKAIPAYRKIEARDLRLKEKSPAFQLGFKNIDLDAIGLRKDYPMSLKKQVFAGLNGELISESAKLSASSIAKSIQDYEKTLLKSEKESNLPFALKTDHESNPYLVLDFHSQKLIKGIKIIGASANGDQNYRKLFISISNDRENWTEIWANDPYHTKAGRMWDVVPGKNFEARFIKIGIKDKGTLTLKNVWVYGS
jgi:hypothetical protein